MEQKMTNINEAEEAVKNAQRELERAQELLKKAQTPPTLVEQIMALEDGALFRIGDKYGHSSIRFFKSGRGMDTYVTRAWSYQHSESYMTVERFVRSITHNNWDQVYEAKVVF